MEKLAINPTRLQWCMNTLKISLDDLSKIDIAEKTLAKVMENKAVLSVKQLEKIANYFNRSLLFFLNPNPVNEDLIYSPQFRTINNQKPLYSKKLNTLIENVEQQRKVYLNLLDTLNKPIADSWYPQDIQLNGSVQQIANEVRQWLDVKDNLTFNELRALVESKGVMVFVSNGYAGKWQINKDSKVRGFALYYDTLPIIVIKKQVSKGAQAFTLMHELAHLLLHKNSMIDEEKDFYSYQGKEKEANEFASNVLMTDEALTALDLNKLQNLDIKECDIYLKTFKKIWCVSGDAILYRLLREKEINQTRYQDYKNLKEKQYQEQERKKQRQKELGEKIIIPRHRHTEPENIFGKSYVATVLDALQNKHITLSKASTHLDNLKIHSLHKLENKFVPF